jgi:hypothetical protein
MNAIKRAWNVEKIQIKKAEKASPSMYANIKPVLERVIASEAFTAQMEETVNKQVDSIVNNNSAFRDIKADNSLSDLFPNLTINEFGKKLYKALANRAYCLLLGQKLAKKSVEINEALRRMQLDSARNSFA